MTKGRRCIDWLTIKGAYVSDPEVALPDIAKRFGVCLQAAKQHSIKEGWVAARAEVNARADEALRDKLVNDKIRNVEEFNLDDIKLVRAMRSEIARELTRLKNAGKLDGRKLMELTSAHKNTRHVGSLALGISTTNNEITGKGGEALNMAPPIINVHFADPDPAE